MHVGVGHRHIAKPQAAQPQEGQEHRLAGKRFAGQGFHAHGAGRRHVAALGFDYPNHVAEFAVAQGALGAGVDDRADRPSTEIGVNDGQLAVSAAGGHHHHATGLVAVGPGFHDLELLAFEIEDETLTFQPIDTQDAVDVRPLDRQGRRTHHPPAARADLQFVERHHGAIAHAHHGVDPCRLIRGQFKLAHQAVGYATDVGAGIEQEVEGSLAVDADWRQHVLVLISAGADLGVGFIRIGQFEGVLASRDLSRSPPCRGARHARRHQTQCRKSSRWGHDPVLNRRYENA